MTIFVDTSAIYALLSADDKRHGAVLASFKELDAMQVPLVSTNYVLLESASLIQRRHGFEPARTCLERALQMLEIVWIGEQEHREAVDLWTKSGKRALSLVDCTSIAIMRRNRISSVVAIDRHFEEAGFDVIPRGDRISDRSPRYSRKHSSGQRKRP